MLIHLTGSDTYRSARRLADLREAFIAKHDPQQLNIAVLDGEQATSEEFRQAVQTTGMFTSKRLVIVDRYSPSGKLTPEAVQSAATSVADPKSDVIVVIRDVITAAKSRGKSVAGKRSSGVSPTWKGEKREQFAPLSAAERITWIQNELKQRQATIVPPAVQRLLVLCGEDMWRLASELDKVITYAGQRPITLADIDQLVMGEATSDIFALTDAIGMRQSGTIARLIRQEISSGANVFGLLAALAQHIRTLVRVRQALDGGVSAGSLATRLGIHPYVAQKSVQQVSHFSADQLIELHHRLVRVDHDLKTSPLDAETLLDIVLLGA